MLAVKRTAVRSGRRFLSFDNVNAKEVDKFSAIGNDWWDSDSLSGTGPLHAMNPARVGFIRSHIARRLGREGLYATRQLAGLRVLDVGCGGGLLAEALARLGADVTAIDPSAQNLSVARAHSQRDPLTAGIQYRQMTVQQLAAEGQRFHAVCTLEVIEHVDDQGAFLQACTECVMSPAEAQAEAGAGTGVGAGAGEGVLDTGAATGATGSEAEGAGGLRAVGGSLFVSTMNRTPVSYLTAVLGAEYVLGMLPPGTHEWQKFVTPAELRHMAEGRCALRVDQVSGLVLRPNTRNPGAGLLHWTVGSDTEVNYIAHMYKE